MPVPFGVDDTLILSLSAGKEAGDLHGSMGKWKVTMKKSCCFLLILAVSLGCARLEREPLVEPVREARIRVAILETTDGSTVEECVDRSVEILSVEPDIHVSRISPEQILEGYLNLYDVLILPGGTATGERNALGKSGVRGIEKRVAQGMGYIGVCAGAYVPAIGWNEKMQDIELLNARLYALDNWERGKQDVLCEARLADDQWIPFTIHFENGPLFFPGEDPYLPNYTSLARYLTDLHAPGKPAGEMVGRDAIVAARYGKGQVLLFSPHPELTPGLGWMLVEAVRWTSRSKAGSDEPISWQSVFGSAP